MELVNLESSSEDDQDVYLNAVAKLKALKNKRPSSNHNGQKDEMIQENKEEMKMTAPKDITIPPRTKKRGSGKRNTTRRRSARRAQQRGTTESDSDLEIVSVEEKLPTSENDLLRVEKKMDDSLNTSEDENYEINIKVLWRSKDVHRLNIRRNESFKKVFEHFANLEEVSVDEILITRKDETIKKNDSPASINLSVIDILEGGIIKKDTASQNAGSQPDDDGCIIKVQTTGKKYITMSVKQDENFKSLLEKCAEELNVEVSKIKLYFDGELVSITDTPDSLEIEDEACFDLRLIPQ